MLPYGVGDHVFFKEGEEGDSGPWGDNDWVVVHIAGSELMLKRGHLIICGIHADQVALCRASGDDGGVAGSASPRPEGAACGPAHSGTQRADAAVVILPAASGRGAERICESLGAVGGGE